MNRPTTSRSSGRALRASALVLVVLSGLSATACSQGAATRPATAPTAAAHATIAAAPAPTAPMADARAAAWAGRPAFTHVSARTEEAYQYAMEHGDVLHWIPCYCGCGAMGHASNLDCYFEPRPDGSISFEEHASFCDICVDITLRTKELVASGMPLSNVRAAIDAEFGGSGPGTDTALPQS